MPPEPLRRRGPVRAPAALRAARCGGTLPTLTSIEARINDGVVYGSLRNIAGMRYRAIDIEAVL